MRHWRTACPAAILAALALAAAGASAASHHVRRHARPHVDGPREEFGCPILPAEDPLNQEVAGLPESPRSESYVASIGTGAHLHPDFGTNPSYGIPYTVVGAGQPKVPIKFTKYGSESDPGPYPVPANAPIEGGGKNGHGDRHVLVTQEGGCTLYELYLAHRRHKGKSWTAGSGAVFNLRSSALRPDGWTSADAAGLPIFPLLARYPEVAAGQIDHALRVTVPHTQRGYIHPATHLASSSTDPALPPMGLRLRLKAGYSLAGFHGQSLVILEALKRFGLIVADNGSPWFITGAPNPGWNDEDLEQIKQVPGSAFEAVETGPIIH
ncbi:MAG TPA: hypothetical protein VLZ06_10285 [Solirubrobacteraceae bacterium]|nr:hypothetical protein [Solirubrobacteraceae bacterium]